MGLEELRQNIIKEKELLKQIKDFNFQLDKLNMSSGRETDKNMLKNVINSTVQQIKIMNNSVPELLNSISVYKSLNQNQQQEKSENLVKISYKPEDKKKVYVTISKKQKEKFLGELSMTINTIKRLKHRKILKKENVVEFKKPGIYAKISNKLFQNICNKYIEKGYFKRLNMHLRKANMSSLLVTYLSMTFFSTLLSFFIAIIGAIILFMTLGNWQYLLLIPGIPFIVLFSFYFFPAAEASGVANSIEQEIPFVTIHMSAIARSGIEPSQIFKILAIGEEYPATKIEIKKILNQINVYGYDLVTALKNTGRETSSRKLSELLNGMATSISGGSHLSEFLDKRSETLMFEYRLEKERYTKTTETFMDIYISLMIAAPMIMTLLLVLISISSINIGLSLNGLTVVIISVVSLINILFLIFLRLNQSNY